MIFVMFTLNHPFKIALLSLSLMGSNALAADVPIVLTADAPANESLAAQDLARMLGRLYPHDRFSLTTNLPATGKAILLGQVSDAAVRVQLAGDIPTVAESFVVCTRQTGDLELGIIAGADARGVGYGVYQLLARLGFGFHLSGDTQPAPRNEAFDFAGWSFANAPLTRERLVFNWHNFLSGCSTWNLPDWQEWIAQSQKMGFNAIMVHAYGNNPMAEFSFQGKAKTVGYLSTTRQGRDWATMHVNDVRRLFGGEQFSAPAFGAEAGFVADDQRVAAAQSLMKEVFQSAAQRDMGVYFAMDVDTPSANPQELITLLPESARFQSALFHGGQGKRIWLPNPDMPEGCAFFRAQVAGLLKVYPQITTLAVWFRGGGTPWMNLKVTDFPVSWQKEYAAEIARTPAAEKFWFAPALFAVGKIVRAYDRALKDCGATHTRLAAGTWNFAFLPAADRFFPAGVPLIGLDYGVLDGKSQLGSSDSRATLREVAARRPVIPVVWAQHDDGQYLGRPYTPLPEFASKLADAKADGFGIIHWMTRPLDLYFDSLAQQVWQNTKDQPLPETCGDFAASWFGAQNRKAMGNYLEAWITDAPQFGRDTTDWFIDRKLTNITEVVAGCRARLAMLNQARTNGLSSEQLQRLDYQRGLEEFIAAFHEAQGQFQESRELLDQGDVTGAREALARCHPEPVIEQFARFSANDGITRGEQGLIVSLNTRWLPHIVSLRQALGLEAVRLSFAPTSHDPLAQAAGTFTFYFGRDHALWECWGEQEPGAGVFVIPTEAKIRRDPALPAAYEEICRAGVESGKPLELAVRPIMADNEKKLNLPAADYRLRLILIDPTSTAPGQRVFDVTVATGSATETQYVFEPVQARYLRLVCHGNTVNDWNSIVKVRIDSLASDTNQPVVSCSTAMPGFPAEHVLDDKPDTRWAAQGTNQWLQFRLAPGAVTRSVGLDFYAADQRQARFEVQASDDGRAWNAVRNLRPVARSTPIKDRIDIFSLAGESNRIVVRDYDVSLGQSGTVRLTLTPLHGRALICGAVLEPK